MGVFDLLDPILYAADARLAGALPPLARLAVWGAAGALVSTGLYWLLSPQAMIVDLKRRIRDAQRALDAHEGELREAWPLMRRSLALALRQVAVILGPAVAASLPLLFLLAWLHAAYGYRFPVPVASARLGVVPATLQARWVTGAPRPRIVVDDSNGQRVADVVMRVPLPEVGRHRWWNAFFGDPNGYLPARGAADAVTVDVLPTTYLGWGPRWIRGWEAPFLCVLLAVSLAFKFTFRIR